MAIGKVDNPIENVSKEPTGGANVPAPQGADKARNSGQGFGTGNANPMSPTPPSPSMGEDTKSKGRGTL